ncbi:hypothetical protein F7725_017722 [Dissostichus mawsoni]|uniref:FIIND domain-containing protein n=1 Tax=Dissostichus mawsoni TaxID=36200 RepID=A0A7J5XPF0_DISMA|nr:hypothetical protein F7725_017722 [Dissostichus mawsoni]
MKLPSASSTCHTVRQRMVKTSTLLLDGLLSVVHITDEGLSILEPLEVTPTHVVVNASELADKWPNSGVPTTPGQRGANTGCTSAAEQRPCGGGKVLTIRLNTGFKPQLFPHTLLLFSNVLVLGED